jgi:hypothetical protein
MAKQEFDLEKLLQEVRVMLPDITDRKTTPSTRCEYDIYVAKADQEKYNIIVGQNGGRGLNHHVEIGYGNTPEVINVKSLDQKYDGIMREIASGLNKGDRTINLYLGLKRNTGGAHRPKRC